MAELRASRTLVKSRPELWVECSDAASLVRHLDAFGEIQITKLEPETAVAWEGEDVRGTVTLEPSGWGTRVVLAATVEGESGHAALGRPGFFGRLLGRWRRSPDPGPAPHRAAASAATVPARADPPSSDSLVSALDSLGMAHRRPFTHG